MTFCEGHISGSHSDKCEDRPSSGMLRRVAWPVTIALAMEAVSMSETSFGPPDYTVQHRIFGEENNC
jgi:hypothetical protein